jgi:hypothetical protein
LKDEDCFAVNGIHLIFPYTEWRPKYFVMSELPSDYTKDDAFVDHMSGAFKEGLHCYLEQGLKGLVEKHSLRKIMEPETVEDYFTTCEHGALHFDNPEVPQSWHLPQLCGFGSSVHVAMQLAVKMGYDVLCLVGCDLGYRNDSVNRFHKDYDKGKEDRLKEAYYADGDNLMGHRIASMTCPVPVVNCTIGGVDLPYPRLSVEEVLNGRLQPGQRTPPQAEMGGDQRDQAAEGVNRGGREGDEVQPRRIPDGNRPRRRK